ncbi:hypothetical protein ACSHWB_35325 [Lentzea sp. HUAS TT2]|uniref:hypothetical protein n=1 Tax=Lentzea sp. HUAS TT2 TaxID=3447454 RepID=UPI003F7245A9
MEVDAFPEIHRTGIRPGGCNPAIYTAAMLEQIVAAVAQVSASPTPEEVWVAEPAPHADAAVNQFVVFLKPEVTHAGVRFGAVCGMVLDKLAAHEIDVHAVRVVNGPFIARARMMESHYGVINEVSRLGERALSAAARKTAHEHFGDAEVLGAHQFLERFPQFSPLALATLFANVGNIKIASGTYAGAVSVLGRKMVLLNGFHPFQLERFTRGDASIVVLECTTTTSWRMLRQEIAGATDAAKAAPGSIRRALFDRSAEFGLSGRSNGVHLSAGPLEGLVEMRRFFGDKATTFDRLLQAVGLSADDFTGSPAAFDLTEEMDALDAVEVLLRS